MSVSMNDYEDSLKAFARRVPELLSRHAATAKLAREIEKLDVAGQLDRRFTLAVVGRMRAGKSTLLNALVGRRLAPVGVKETTATLNWFDYGDEEQSAGFWAHWKQMDEPASSFPLSQLRDFVGQSEKAKATAYLRFFAPSEMLKRVRIVDTPGTGSTIEAHEETIGDFMDDDVRREAIERNEQATFTHGGRADAVVLVLPPTVKEIDTELMTLFERKSRIPGQGAYNTIAVIQKWETLNSDDPLAEADRLAAVFKQRLTGRVSEVLPVSGILAQFAADVPEAAMDRLAFLASRTNETDLLATIKREVRFQADRSGVPLSGAERNELYNDIRWHLSGGRPGEVDAWPAVKIVLRHAAVNDIKDGAALKAEIRKLSRLDDLNALLEERFFKIASVIQAGSVLKKALDPCEQALLLLKDGYERRKELAELGDKLVDAFPQAPLNDSNLRRKLSDYLGASTKLVHEELDPLEATWRELYERVTEARTSFGLLMSDITQLDVLSDDYELPLDDDLIHELRCLFGINGVETHQRLALPADADKATMLERADTLQAAVAHRKRRGAMDEKVRKVLDHADDRLQALFGILEDH